MSSQKKLRNLFKFQVKDGRIAMRMEISSDQAIKFLRYMLIPIVFYFAWQMPNAWDILKDVFHFIQ